MRTLVLVLLTLWCQSSLAALDLGAATHRRISGIELNNGSRVQDKEVLDLLGLRRGDRYGPEVVQLGLTRLSQKQGIRDVVIRGREQDSGVVLAVEVTAEPLIRSLRFRGNRAVKDKELKSLVATGEDRPVRPALLAKDTTAIQKRYAEEGFDEAQASAQVQPRTDPHWVDLTFEIHEGAPRRVVRVEGSAEPAMERSRMLALLGLRKGSPASRRKLREGVQLLERVLHRDGYPEARVGKATFQPEGGGLVLVLPLQVGRALDVRVEGVDEWTAGPLREVVHSRYGEPIDEDWVRETAELLVAELRREGYRDAKVTPAFREAYGAHILGFQVDRGPKIRVAEVRFIGNTDLESDRLRRYMSLVEGGLWGTPPFTQEALERDLRVLAELYASEGYLEARVSLDGLDVAKDGQAALRLRVEEGQRYRLGRIAFAGDAVFSPEEALAAADLRAGQPANPGGLEEARVRLLRALDDRGYVDAQVTLQTRRDAEAALLYPEYTVHAGPLVRFGEVVVSGNARTQTKVIRRELPIRAGEPWSLEKIRRGRQALYALGFFQRVRIEPLTTGPDDTVRDVLVQVEEQDAGSVTFGLGYGTEEGVKGYASISHANLQGAGRSLGFRYEFDRFDRSYAVNFREPWLLDQPYALGLSLVKSYQEREAYNLSALALQGSLEREFGEFFRASLVYTLEENRLTDVVDEQVVGSEGLSTYLLSSVGPLFAWDSRDDPFNPRRGYYHTLQAEWATAALGSEVQFERYAGTVSGFFSAGNTTLALLARGGVALRLGQTADLPVNKRFFLGGRSTIRGFQKDAVGPVTADGTPAGGDVMVNLKAELRHPIWKNLGGALFWDAGNVWNRSADFPGSSGLRQGVGGSLRYITPVGPIALDLGFNLDRRPDEDPYVWYFTIGNVF